MREHFSGNFEQFVEQLKNALLSSFIVTYAQGMSLLQIASVEKNYGLNLSEIAKIWRGGCIIRSAPARRNATRFCRKSRFAEFDAGR
ncbi:MAG: hypothetical protein WKF71_17835 [Pyrinomonadaceae bacterium]